MENTMMKKLGRGMALLVGLISASAALTGTAVAGADDDLIAKIKSTKRLDVSVGTSPFLTSVDASGQAHGIMPDILRAFLKRENIDATLNPVAMPFDSIIPALVAGKVDLAANTMFVTPARASKILFSGTMFYNSEALFVAKGNPLGIKSVADLCGHVGATYKGTVWVPLLEKASKECPNGKSIEIRLYVSGELVLQDILTGRVDGGLVDHWAGQYALSQDPSLKFEAAVGYVPVNRASNAIALPINPKYKDFIGTFNKTYAAMLADGTVKAIFEKHGLKPTEPYLAPE
jgi:ABC-type amino acid transport substrate-binding protein